MYTYKFKKGLSPSLLKTLFVNEDKVISANAKTARPLNRKNTDVLIPQPKRLMQLYKVPNQ